jgi:uncharacterized iron-regulated membrane protein
MGWLREGMNGLVVLASGILTFGAGFYKDLALSTRGEKALFACSACALLLTILCGVMCAFWLNRYVNLRENDGDRQRPPAADPATAKPLDARVMPAGMQTARRWYYGLYYGTLSAFCASMIFITLLLLVGICSTSSSSKDKKDCQPCAVTVQTNAAPLRYNITISARHIGRHGTQVQHTFLLDQSTGRVWQMFCRKGGGEVEFRKIGVEGVVDSKDVSPRY